MAETENISAQEVTMEVEHVNKKPIKRIVPEKIAEVGQWKAAKEEDKAVTEEDKVIIEEDKAVIEEVKADMSTEDANMN
ncbi:hypothetical protein KCU92_g10109, partial [Aureobasidium melanogenum]|jgi:hypothetical protein